MSAGTVICLLPAIQNGHRKLAQGHLTLLLHVQTVHIGVWDPANHDALCATLRQEPFATEVLSKLATNRCALEQGWPTSEEDG